jgi:hypothetical protein
VKYRAGFLSIILWAALWTVSLGAAQGYEVVDVKNGATLKGSVNFSGSLPPVEKNIITQDVEYCGGAQEVDKYVVDDSRVKNAVVWLEGVEKGKVLPKKSVPIIIKKCVAEPHVGIGFVGGEYLFKNEDEILHTIQLKLGLAYQKRISERPVKDGATIYNIALPLKDLQIEKPIKNYHKYSEETGFIQIRSNIHNWINGYIFIFDHPYAAVTDEKGAFVMDNIPPDEYLLKVWHEGFGMQEKKIKVTPGGLVEANIAFDQ